MYQSRRAELTEPDGLTLLDYLGWLRRRWWVLIAGAVVGLAAAAGLTAIQPRTYTATTSVQVRQIGPDANPNAKVNLDTEAQVIRSTVVATRAQALLRTQESPESLARRVRVTVPPNSQVLHVSFESPSRVGARDGSRAVTQAYLTLRVDIARRDLDTEITELRKQIDDINRQLTQVAGKIASLPPSNVERQRAEAERTVLTNRLGALNDRLSPLLTAALDPGLIISEPVLPSQPTSPNRVLNLGSGLGAGLLLGIALALLLDRLDTRVRRGRDIAGRLGVPVLLELAGRVPAPTLLPATDKMSRELGRLRNVLLTSVPPRASGAGGRRMLVAAASPGAATGFLVGNLAAAYARTGAQVAVVTTDPESPLAAMTGGEPGPGLAEVLRRDLTALQALAPVPAVPRLRMLLPGRIDLESELPVAGLLEVLAELADRFDHVLVETAPASLAVEAQALSTHVDAVLLVAEARRTRSREVAVAVQQFEQVQAPFIGAVLVPHLPASRAVKAPASAAATRASSRDGQAALERTAKRLAGSQTLGGGEETIVIRPPVVHADAGDDAVVEAEATPTSESTMVLPRATDQGISSGGLLPGAAPKGSTYRAGGKGRAKVTLPPQEEQG